MRQDKYHDTQSVPRTGALLDEPEAHKSRGEVIFPAFETTHPAEESDAKVKKPVSARKRGPLVAVVLVLVAIGITSFIYLRNRPKPVPTPTSVDLPTYTTSTAGEMPSTAFRISPEKQQLIGVQYGTVEYQTISKSLRAVGKVAYDETKLTRINPKVEGWIETVYVDFTGKLVQKGQPLLSIYSPDLV